MLPMLVPMLTNVIGGLVADTATNMAKEHVMDMVQKVVPPEAMAVVDQMVSADPNNPCASMSELIDRMADPEDMEVPAIPAMPEMPSVGTMSIDCRVSFDPATMDISVEKL